MGFFSKKQGDKRCVSDNECDGVAWALLCGEKEKENIVRCNEVDGVILGVL